MKGVVLHEPGGPGCLRYADIDDPVTGAGEVVVRISHAAVNRRDLFITYGQYPRLQLPAVLGSDGAGWVAAVGDGVAGLATGDEVIVFPSIGWGKDSRIPHRGFRTLGMPDHGTWAQLVKVPAENVFAKPEHLRFDEAAALPLAGVTAYRAMATRGEVHHGSVVLVPGVGGGVATFLVQIAAARGARVYVTSSSVDNLAVARELGAAGGVIYTSKGWQDELREMAGAFDLIVDGVGGEALVAGLELAKPGGRIVSYGATAAPRQELLLPRIFLKQLDFLGSSMGTVGEFAEMLDLYAKGGLHPCIAGSFPLSEAGAALSRMENGHGIGKLTLVAPS